MPAKAAAKRKEEVPLSKAAELLLEECRMVIPGVQALLGFQLTVVFSPGFDTKLSAFEQQLHLVALAMVALTVAIIMTPAAYQRQSLQHEVSEGFVRLCARLLLWSMLPLLLGICLDFYLIGRVVVGDAPSAALTAAIATIFVTLWFALPRLRFLRRLLGDRD